MAEGQRDEALDGIKSLEDIRIYIKETRDMVRFFAKHLDEEASRVNTIIHGDLVVGLNAQVQDTREDTEAAAQRQRFYFDFLRQSLKQSEVSFWLSIAFMTGGAVVILIGAALALVYASNADLNYLPLVTGLTGVLITVGGGALAVHARRAKAHVTEQAERIGAQVDKDDGLQTALRLVDQVGDEDLRDRIRTAVALQALNVRPNPETIADRLFSGADSKDEIEPGDSKS
jgi:hypothetical protein